MLLISHIPIRRPLSPGGGWIEVSLYRAYADLARENLTAGRYFEAIVVCSVGYDVLVNTLPDRIRLHYYDKLTPDQQRVIGDIEASDRQTAGTILNKLREANILHRRIDNALSHFNKERNTVIHPIEIQEKLNPNGNTYYVLSLKQGAVVPYKATKEDAERHFRYFCHIIDLSGGESPRKNEKANRVYPSLSEQMRQIKAKRRLIKFHNKGERS
jgi:hypothetical protein